MDSVHTLLFPTFKLAVRDDIIRKNPAEGAFAEVKKGFGGRRKLRRALTVEQQRAFIRTIPMMGPVYDVLSGEYERQLEEGFCTRTIDGVTNFIFMNRFGNPHSPQTINRAIKRITTVYNAEEEVKAKKEKREPVIIPKISCHIFRHTFASRLCEKETNVKVIQQIMGHADVATTMNIYAEVNETTTRVSMENLEQSYTELF